MGFFSAIKRMMRNEIAADVSQNNGFDKLVEWWGIDQAKPKAINETTYFTCLKVLSETMGKMPLKFYQEDESGGRVRAPTNNAADMLMYRPNPIRQSFGQRWRRTANITAMLTYGFRQRM